MDWKPLNSSHLSAAAYDEHSQTLQIEFHQGQTYSYDAVPKDTADGLFTASSPGKYFNRSIKPYYSGY